MFTSEPCPQIRIKTGHATGRGICRFRQDKHVNHSGCLFELAQDQLIPQGGLYILVFDIEGAHKNRYVLDGKPGGLDKRGRRICCAGFSG